MTKEFKAYDRISVIGTGDTGTLLRYNIHWDCWVVQLDKHEFITVQLRNDEMEKIK